MNKLELYGTIDETGAFTLQNRNRFQEWCMLNRNKNVRIRFERRGKKRSLPQNSYYHGVVVQEVKLGLLGIGYDMTADEVHFFLKQKFNTVQMPGKDGLMIEVPGSTTDLTTVAFCEYVDRIAQWAAEYLGIHIPMPNENLKMAL